MNTRLIFVDDSKDHLHSCFGAVVATGDQVAYLERGLTVLRKEIEAELLVRDLTEFHGYEIFQAVGPWKDVNPEERFNVFFKILNLWLEADFNLIMRSTRISEFKSRYHSMQLEAITFENLLERVHEYLETLGAHGLVTSDIQDAHSTEIRANLINSRLFGTRGYRSQELTTILDTVHFVESHQSAAIQFADIATFIWRRMIGKPPTDKRSKQMLEVLGMMVDALVPNPRGQYQSIR
jgi:tryptophan 2,3-dioxygenase